MARSSADYGQILRVWEPCRFPGDRVGAADQAGLTGRAARGYLGVTAVWENAPMKLTLDLHDIYNRGHDIDRALRNIMDEAARKKAPVVEIIPGKGSGQLKKHVLRFLEQKEIKAQYHRVEKDSKNFGRIFVHFRWK
jgi:DNA-nicking Smr family endonuclease